MATKRKTNTGQRAKRAQRPVKPPSADGGRAAASAAVYAVGDQVQTERGAGFVESVDGDTFNVRLYRPKGRRDVRPFNADELKPA